MVVMKCSPPFSEFLGECTGLGLAHHQKHGCGLITDSKNHVAPILKGLGICTALCEVRG